MEHGGNPHPDEVLPPSLDEGLDFHLEQQEMGEHPPLPLSRVDEATEEQQYYWTEWGLTKRPDNDIVQ